MYILIKKDAIYLYSFSFTVQSAATLSPGAGKSRAAASAGRSSRKEELTFWLMV
jgi:hypothetical protein